MKTAKRICKVCKIAVLHKNAKNYSFRICKGCESTSPGSILPPGAKSSISESGRRPNPARGGRRVRLSYKERIPLHDFALRLKQNLPASEVWFQKLWESSGVKDEYDVYNQVWYKFIPDLVNHKLKYVIEIDGTYHRKGCQIVKDRKKDNFYRTQGYNIFRVEAFSQESFLSVVEAVERLRLNLIKKPWMPKTILRKSGVMQ